jgi:putative acetyltransferase
MANLIIYQPEMRSDIEDFFKICLSELGWEYQPGGRHHDILNIDTEYMTHGCFWCLYESNVLIGTVGVNGDEWHKTAEMKRLYVLPEQQRKGYGGYLFSTALEYIKQNGFYSIRLSTRHDRSAACHLIEKYEFRQIDKYNDNDFAELFYELDLIGYSKI